MAQELRNSVGEENLSSDLLGSVPVSYIYNRQINRLKKTRQQFVYTCSA